MIAANLTKGQNPAHKAAMRGRLMDRARLVVLLGAIPVAGCISLEAPDQPIVIELNINITQEVIYRLADDASNAIDENAGIF